MELAKRIIITLSLFLTPVLLYADDVWTPDKPASTNVVQAAVEFFQHLLNLFQ
jgi:hypothetical protein